VSASWIVVGTIGWQEVRRWICESPTANTTNENLEGPMTTVETTTAGSSVTSGARGRVVRPATVTCSWCSADVTVPAKGRVPKWCGTSCRHRAWEQTRAAASGRSAVDVVERVVTVQLPAPTPTPTPAPTAPSGPAAPTGSGWAPLLTELVRQLDTGRIYTRDLTAITPAFDQALQAFNRRLDPLTTRRR